ncbi:hypothetical protein CCH79_00005956 [Gambusia affinis]|uniref:Serine/threonine-protein phosphatase 2A 55 kDa regulatory subunit B n=1 Tax=Gambusia affinis TaxID=33528 RepID=A0A315VL53_GAMAF|nr:hypothetical protein CCH79_00005956 [Gambusia affinis]
MYTRTHRSRHSSSSLAAAQLNKTVKLWKISERDKRPEGYNLKDEDGRFRDPSTITTLRVRGRRKLSGPSRVRSLSLFGQRRVRPTIFCLENLPRQRGRLRTVDGPCSGLMRHTSIWASSERHGREVTPVEIQRPAELTCLLISASSGQKEKQSGKRRPICSPGSLLFSLPLSGFYLANGGLCAGRLLGIFEALAALFTLLRLSDIVDIKPANMEELTEVITSAEFHPQQCHTFAYSSSKGSIRLCDMRQAALCDKHCKCEYMRRKKSLEIISSISDVKFSHNGRYLMTRDYLTVKVWDLQMENKPLETYQVIVIMTGSYNNFFRMFDRNTKRDVTLEASRENSKPRAILKPRKVCVGGKRRKDEISVDSLDFSKKILHTTWHPHENIIAVAATNNLYIFQDKVN